MSVQHIHQGTRFLPHQCSRNVSCLVPQIYVQNTYNRLRSEYYQLHTSSFGSKNSHFVQFEKAMKPTDLHLSFSLADDSCSNENIICGSRVYPGLLEENIRQTRFSSAAADPGWGGCAWRRHAPCVRLGWARPRNACATYRWGPRNRQGRGRWLEAPHPASVPPP